MAEIGGKGMSILDELQTLLWKRSRQFEREAKMALTEDLSIVYRAKAAEAYSIYIILLNMKKKAMQDGKNTDCSENGESLN